MSTTRRWGPWALLATLVSACTSEPMGGDASHVVDVATIDASDGSPLDSLTVDAGIDATIDDTATTDDTAMTDDAATIDDATTPDDTAVTDDAATTGDAASMRCAFTISPSTANFTAAGGTGSFDVSVTPSDCTWTPVSNATWLTVTTPAMITGPGTVDYTVDIVPHSAPSRTGNITLTVPSASTGTLTFRVTQSL